jgi:hypothetical protein
MSKSILKVILLCVIYATANTVHCQTDWQSYQTQKSLAKNAKKEMVKYKSYSYTAVGYILKKQFVEGQSITFYNTKIKTPPYFDTSYLNYLNSISNRGETDPIISGIYFVKDSISYLASTIIERFDRDSEYSRANIQLIFKVSNTYDGKKLTAKPDEAKELSIEAVDLVSFSGDYKRGDHRFTLQKRSNPNDYLLKIGFFGDTLESSVGSDYLKKFVIPYISYLFKISRNNSDELRINLDFDDYLNKSEVVRLSYKNGDFFVGKVDKGLTPDEGKYTFSNGEVFKGKCRNRPEIWQEGEWVFIDGSVESGSWIKKYDASEVDLSSAETLTDKHKLAIRIYEEKLQKQQKQQEEEKIAKQQEEEKKQIAKQERKNNLITKYGEKWANLILQGKFTIGMTKEMMKDIKMGEVMGGENDLAVEYAYEKSISTSGGQRVEIWELNRQIAREWRNMTILGINAYDFNAPKFPTLVFTNSKLTDIYR